jgi:hypothetical protein
VLGCPRLPFGAASAARVSLRNAYGFSAVHLDVFAACSDLINLVCGARCIICPIF